MKLWRSWLWLLLIVPVGVGIARLRFDVEILNLLPDQLSVVRGLKTHQKHFSNARELILTLEAPTAEDAEDAARLLAQTLRAETNLVANVTWQPAWLEDPAQAMELVAYLWLNRPPDVFGQLTKRLAVANLATTLAETRERLATTFSPNDLAFGGYDPYGLTRLPESVSRAGPIMGMGEELFASPDGTFRVVFVEAKADLSGCKACRSWLAEIQRVVGEARRAGRLAGQAEVHYTGRPAFVAEISESMERDMRGCSVGMLAVIGILLGMGVDFSIHIQLALRRNGGDLLVVRRSVGRALLLAGSTTVAGFGALAFSSNAGMASLGLVCALGITLAVLVAVYLLPVWWKAWHGRVYPPRKTSVLNLDTGAS